MAKKLSRPQILAIGTILDCARPFRKPVAFNILTGMYEIRSSTLDALERQDMIKRNPRHEYEVTESGIAEYRKAAPGRLETMEAYDTSKAAVPAQPPAAGTLWQGVEPGAMVIASTEGWTPAEPGSDAKAYTYPEYVTEFAPEHGNTNKPERKMPFMGTRSNPCCKERDALIAERDRLLLSEQRYHEEVERLRAAMQEIVDLPEDSFKSAWSIAVAALADAQEETR